MARSPISISICHLTCSLHNFIMVASKGRQEWTYLCVDSPESVNRKLHVQFNFIFQWSPPLEKSSLFGTLLHSCGRIMRCIRWGKELHLQKAGITNKLLATLLTTVSFCISITGSTCAGPMEADAGLSFWKVSLHGKPEITRVLGGRFNDSEATALLGHITFFCGCCGICKLLKSWNILRWKETWNWNKIWLTP